MAGKPKNYAPKIGTAPPLAAQRLIAEQTAAFLENGGKIQRIPRGVTGQANLAGPRHITIAKSSAESESSGGKKKTDRH